ncbi:MAG: glycosyltransferase [Solobacterium sp.]|nr:glycosyltransferase [Solobacterium sp.]
MISILMAFSSLTGGGMSSFVKEIVRSIDKDKYHIDLLVYEEGDPEITKWMEDYGCGIYLVPNPKKDYPGCKEKIAALHQKNAYHVMHSLNLFNSGYMVQIAYQLGIPVRIVNSHASQDFHEGFIYQIYKYLMRNKMKKYGTHFIACSEIAGKYLFDTIPFEVIENAIDVERFSFKEENRNLIRQQYHFEEDDFVIGMIGMVTKNKNQSFMLDVLKDMDSKYKLLIVGDGDYRKEIDEKIQQLNLTDRVTITGWIQDTCPYYSALDCLVMPSFSEGFPLTGLEGQASGLPIIFSDTITKEIQIAKNVYYLSTQDVKGWQEKIISFSETQNNRANSLMGTKFDSRVNIKEWYAIYESK